MPGAEEPTGRARGLMELGLLVERSGVLAAVDGDRGAVLGVLLEAVERLCGAGREALVAEWRLRARDSLDDGLVLARLSERERA
ncbi:conjugal transfer protein TraD [Salinarimonas soli]|uniref:Uncharacterized protein n=1 Tax=Salinarimonas soli TaxID=1638099 RepID=A0A5B2VW89_9HYPH|nr:conjugal transfer protein TraD [Salinarimonas soli]KAA2242319.1 hypothetical protein F0L46_03275 [Salinarimonas soli]